MNVPRFFSISRLLAISIAGFGLCQSVQAQLVNGDFSQFTGTLQYNAGVVVGNASPDLITLGGWSAFTSGVPDSNVFIYGPDAGAGQLSSLFFLPNPAPGFDYGVQFDSTRGFSAASGDHESFTTGAGIQQTFSLTAGVYNLSFYINNEVGYGTGHDGDPNYAKGGTSGILVDLGGIGGNAASLSSGALSNTEFTVTNLLGVSRANSQWEKISTLFTVAQGGDLQLKFLDDPNPLLANQILSSNIALSGVSIAAVPEPAVSSLFAIGVVSLCGFQFLRKRRRERVTVSR